MQFSRAEASVWKSLAAGAVGGLVASLAMNQFQAALTAVAETMSQKKSQREQSQQSDRKQESGDDATVKAAQYVSANVFDRQLRDDEKKWAGPVVHYALGTSLGAIYGALAPSTKVEAGAGAAYGAAVWLGADEIAVPLLHLSPPPNKTPASSHIRALASHLVFGLVTHFTKKLVLS